jgi:hypothetical protein
MPARLERLNLSGMRKSVLNDEGGLNCKSIFIAFLFSGRMHSETVQKLDRN